MDTNQRYTANQHHRHQEQQQQQQQQHGQYGIEHNESVEYPLPSHHQNDNSNMLDIDLDPNVYSRSDHSTIRKKRLFLGSVLCILVISIIGVAIGLARSRANSTNASTYGGNDSTGAYGSNSNFGDSTTITGGGSFTNNNNGDSSGNGGNNGNGDGGSSNSGHVYVGAGNSNNSNENSDNTNNSNDNNENNSDNSNNHNNDNNYENDNTSAGAGGNNIDVPNAPNDHFTPANVGNNNEDGDEIDDEILTILRGNSVLGGHEFNNIDSYQYKAYLWVSQTFDPLQHNTIERILQRYALACIFYSTYSVRTPVTDKEYAATIQQTGGNLDDVPGWITRSGWLENDDECTWYRITCNDNKQVTHIQLYSNRLTGTFPVEVTILKHTLEVIDIYNNLVYNVGSEGNDFLGELTNLKKLYYSSTSFQYDGIPPAIGRLTNLEEYDCSFSLYFGSLKGEIFQNLNQLEYLYIGGNSFNSSIPNELAQLPKLQYFYADYTDLTGDINFLTQMPSIVELWIDNNPKLLGATIPTDIGLIPASRTLRSLSLTGCELSGTLPTSLGLLNLEQVWLYGNNFHSTIPTELGQLSRLKRIGLEDNDLTGAMPMEVCANREPIGLISKLDSDCGPDQQVQCTCCTCCGPQCSGSGS